MGLFHFIVLSFIFHQKNHFQILNEQLFHSSCAVVRQARAGLIFSKPAGAAQQPSNQQPSIHTGTGTW